MKSVCLIFLLFYFTLDECLCCGVPAIPKYGSVHYSSPSHDLDDEATSFPVGTIVTYNCTNTQLFGSKERKCVGDNSWTGRAPICASNLSHDKIVGVYAGRYSAQQTKIAIDNNRDTCLILTSKRLIDGKQFNVTLSVTLVKRVLIRAIQVIFAADTSVKFDIVVSDKNSDNKGVACSQTYRKVEQDDRTSKVKTTYSGECDKPTYGNVVNIQYTTAPVCEINIFTSEEFDCGTPEIPKSGKGHPQGKSSDSIIFACSEDYKIKGADTVHCQKDGSWMPSSPVCVVENLQEHMPRKVIAKQKAIVSTIDVDLSSSPSSTEKDEMNFDYTYYNTSRDGSPSLRFFAECSPMKNATHLNGVIVLSNGYKTRSTAHIVCDKGYKPQGKLKSICWPNGLWSHEGHYELRCKAIKCPAIFFIPGGVAKPQQSESQALVNATSFNSVIDIHCDFSTDNGAFESLHERYCGMNELWVKREEVYNLNAQSDVLTLCKNTTYASEKRTNDVKSGKAYVWAIVAGVGTSIFIFAIIALTLIVKSKLKPITIMQSNHISRQRRSLPSHENIYSSAIYEEADDRVRNIFINSQQSSTIYYSEPRERLSVANSRYSALPIRNESSRSLNTSPKVTPLNKENEIYGSD